MIYYGDALAYVKETPQVMKRIIDRMSDGTIWTPRLPLKGGLGDIVVTGTGSSYHAGTAAKESLQSITGARVSVVYPSELAGELAVCVANAVVVGISQQGTSTAVIEALDMAKNRGYYTFAMTGEENTEIMRHADETIMIDCGPEDAGATTKGYTATVLTLILFGLQILCQLPNREQTGRERRYWNTAFASLPEKTGRILKEQMSVLDKIACDLAGFHGLMIISDGRYKNLMGEIMLKFNETCRKYVFGMEAEQFCHGMYNMVQDDTAFLFLTGGNDERVERLVRYYRSRGHKTCVLSLDQEADEKIPFGLIVCVQYLFIKLSRLEGINVNVPKDPEFHKIMGSKLEEKGETEKL